MNSSENGIKDQTFKTRIESGCQSEYVLCSSQDYLFNTPILDQTKLTDERLVKRLLHRGFICFSHSIFLI